MNLYSDSMELPMFVTLVVLLAVLLVLIFKEAGEFLWETLNLSTNYWNISWWIISLITRLDLWFGGISYE